MLRVLCNCICIHTCNYVYHEFLLRYTFIFMCYLNRGSPARRESARRVSIERKWSQSIANKFRPDLKYCCKDQVPLAHYYNNLLHLEMVFYGNKSNATPLDQGGHSSSRVSRWAISCGKSCQRTTVIASKPERASSPMLSNSVLRDRVYRRGENCGRKGDWSII